MYEPFEKTYNASYNNLKPYNVLMVLVTDPGLDLVDDNEVICYVGRY